MREKTLKFNNIRLHKKEFCKSKEPSDLMSVNVDQIVVSVKFKHNNEGFKYFISYQEGEIVRPSCIILHQLSGYIKYFENGGKNMSFLIKDDEVWEKYEQIWSLIKNKQGIKFHGKPIYEKKYLKAKVREFDAVIETNILGNGVPKRYVLCLLCLHNYWFCYENWSKNNPQVYLEECKYRIKKIHMSRFINAELKSDSESESESELEPDSKAESKSDTELIAKLKSDSE